MPVIASSPWIGTYAAGEYTYDGNLVIGNVTITSPGESVAGYLTIRSTGSISVTGNLNMNGMGWIGGAGNERGTGRNGYTPILWNDTLVGGAINHSGGYLAAETNGDVFNGALYTDMIAAGYTEEQRRKVFPGGGGGGGSGARGGGGGSGGGYIELYANGGIFITGLITTKGLKNGGNGTSGTINYVGTPCINGCGGTWPNTWNIPPCPTWNCGARGGRSRTQLSRPGNPPPCCAPVNTDDGCPGVSFVSVREPTWPDCGCGGAAIFRCGSCPSCKHDGAGCCHYGRAPNCNCNSGCNCNSSNDGAGGAGGGVLLYSLGPIVFNPGNINLSGYYGTTMGGTLKVFHGGIFPLWICTANNYTPTPTLLSKAGGLYLEPIYEGFSADIRVPDLTSIATEYPTPNTEVVKITCWESTPSGSYVPVGMAVNYGTHINSVYIGDQWPINLTTNWTVLSAYSWTSSTLRIGPSVPFFITQSMNGLTYPDSIGRTWTYLSGGFPGNVTEGWFLLNPNERLYYIYPHNLGEDTNIALGSSPSQRSDSRQKILWTQKQLIYSVNQTFAIGGVSFFATPVTALPMWTDPDITDFSVLDILSTPFENDITVLPNISPYYNEYWNQGRYTIPKVRVEGYDDLEISAETITYWGSFQITAWQYNWGDHSAEYFARSSTPDLLSPRQVPNTVLEAYIYHNPSIGSYPTDTNSLSNIEPSGVFLYGVTAIPNINCYTHQTPYTLTGLEVGIKERWPTPLFYGEEEDFPLIGIRDPFVPRPHGNNGWSKYSDNQIISGYADALDVTFRECSIIRTFPITGWYFRYDITDTIADVVTAADLYGDVFDSQTPDIPVSLTALGSAEYQSPGWYNPTLVVEASVLSTGWNITGSRYIFVYPPPPTAAFDMDVAIQSLSEYVPILVTAVDVSISATNYPISAYIWSIFDGPVRTIVTDTCTVFIPYQVIEHDWKWHTHDPYGVTVDNSLNNICLTVHSSAYGHRGAPPASGDIFFITSNDTLCKHLYLLEKLPLVGFNYVTGSTVLSTYNADLEISANLTTPYISAGGRYISGYSPVLTIRLSDLSIPQSYPISSYNWDFGDYYADVSNLSSIVVPTSSLQTDWFNDPQGALIWNKNVYPVWYTNEKGHETEHTYMLPGDYTITLTAEASTTASFGICTMQVHVEEILPTCGLQSHLTGANWSTTYVPTGYAPLTVYFTATSIIPGSFPIGRIDWDFGDGEVLRIDRWDNNYTNSITGSDPRWYNNGVIEHTFNRRLYTDPGTFLVQLSVYNDYTNNYINCRGTSWIQTITAAKYYNVGPIFLPNMDTNIHVIKNRLFDNNELIVLEDERDGNVYNIIQKTSNVLYDQVTTTTTTTTTTTVAPEFIGLAAVAGGNFIYISTDSGATLTPHASALSWGCITGDSSGIKLAAAVSYPPGSIYTSIDSGVTWNKQPGAGIGNWEDITSSSDGVKLAAVKATGMVYTSIDSGVTWVAQVCSGLIDRSGITSSSDGIKLAVCGPIEYIQTSPDSGTTWVTCTAAGIRDWTAIDSSSDGIKLVACDIAPGYIYTSVDGGVTWTACTAAGIQGWIDVACSADGNTIVGAIFGAYLKQSKDGGTTWIDITGAGSRQWTGVTITPSGSGIVAWIQGDNIYTSEDEGSTWMIRTSVGTKLWNDVIVWE